MALGNTPRRLTMFFVEASKSYAFGVRFQDPAGAPVDLTEMVVRLVLMQPAHLGGSEALTVMAEIDDPTSGVTLFSLQAEDLALDVGSYAYDATLVTADGYSIPFLKGSFEVGPNTDVDTANIYDYRSYGSEITVILDHGVVSKVVIERVVDGPVVESPPNPELVTR